MGVVDCKMDMKEQISKTCNEFGTNLIKMIFELKNKNEGWL